MLPYLKLLGPVECDETLINRNRWCVYKVHTRQKWAFGLICRDTHIPIIFHVMNKMHWTLSQIVKAYVPQGATVFTDAHSSYINWHGGKSKLSAYGYYHFWINHSEFYVHSKYPFITTGKIESTWRALKNVFPMMHNNANPHRLDEILNTYCCQRIIRSYKMYNFTLRRIKEYFSLQLNKYFKR